MALGSSVPPRAYTREILTTAFNWLQTQPEAVRTKATTPDALVALYLATTNKHGGFKPDYGQSSLETEAPVSSQAFMSDLKNLAEGLKEFDGSKTRRSAAPCANPVSDDRLSTSPPAQTQVQSQSQTHSPAPAAAAMAAPRAVTRSVPISAPPVYAESTSSLNERSLSMLREVQLAMNLSSETEAMNMMIALAYKNLKSVIA